MLWPGFLHGLQVGSASPWTSMGCTETACFTMVLIVGCRGFSAPVPGVLPFPSFFTDLVVCRVVFLTDLQSFLQLWLLPLRCYPPTLSHHPLDHQWVHHGAGWHWLHGTQGKFLVASYRSYLCSPLTTKTLPHKPNTVCLCYLVLRKQRREHCFLFCFVFLE